MTMTSEEQVILKTDVLGRVRTPAARREQLLDEFEKSGLSGQKFAELVGVNYQTFASWAQQRRRVRGDYPAKPPAKKAKELQWLEAVVEKAPAEPHSLALVLELPGGARVNLNDVRQAALAAALLKALSC